MRITNWNRKYIRAKQKKLSEPLFTERLTPSLPQVIYVYSKPKGFISCQVETAKKIILKGGED
jgi:hypothetical protein